MELYSEGKNHKLYKGNSLDILEIIEPNSIDSIVTDPPYELNFMSKDWDNSGIAFSVDIWKKCFEVLKPGGYLLAFGGTRTFHRIACAIEDAGFEIRDTIMWLYGSGFPKSMNIGLTIDKKLGAQGQRGIGGFNVGGIQEQKNRKAKLYIGSNSDGSKQNGYNDYKTDLAKQWQGWGTCLKPAYEPVIVARKPVENSVVENVLKYGVGGINIDECRIYNDETIKSHDTQKGTFAGKTQTMPKFKGRLSFGQYEEKAERIEYTQHEGRFPSNVILTYNEENKNEVCGGMPYTKSVESEANWEKSNCDSVVSFTTTERKSGVHFGDEGSASRYFYNAKETNKDNENGRFPSNVVLTYDEADKEEVCGGMPYTTGGNRHTTAIRVSEKNSGYGFDLNTLNEYNDKGSASRYFYCAKASKKDRDIGLYSFEEKQTGELQGGRKENSAGSIMKNANGGSRVNPYAGAGIPKKNIHPTVKPTELMQYLIRLVSPKGATILDIFNGSGSTGKAIMFENKEREANYKYIGVDLSDEYLAISQARIEFAEKYEEEQEIKVGDKVLQQMSFFELLEDENEK